jgi:hypothetical protein
MPRRAAADNVLPIEKLDRPPPPTGMAEAAAVIWRTVIGNMRSRWFSPENFALLETYCTLTAEKKRLEAAFSRLDVTDPQYERLTVRHDKMAAQALAHARSLRLTPKSNVTNREARDPLRGIKKPWEL